MGHSLNTSPWQDSTLEIPCKRNSSLDITQAHRNGFSKSLGDISSLSSPARYQRKAVLFEEDLRAHAEMLDRARTRFRRLELKYPDVFKHSSRASSISSLNVYQASSSLKQPSIELSVHGSESGNQSFEQEVDRLGDLAEVPVYRKYSGQRRKAPLLSSSMRASHLEGSCDSAFDEIDRESIHSQEQSPTNIDNNSANTSSRFLYPGDSVESDKDSGIYTDQPSLPAPQSPIKRAKFAEVGEISKSLSFSQPSLVSESNFTDEKQSTRAISRQGILKSSAYRNQGIRSESLDAEFPLDRVRYQAKKKRLLGLKTGKI